MASPTSHNSTTSHGAEGEGESPVYVDYERLMSRAARQTLQAKLRDAAVYMLQDGYIKMSSGFPNPEMFPIVGTSFTLQDGTVLTADKKELDIHLQYGISHGYPDLRNWMIELQRRVHNPPTQDSSHPGHMETIITCGAMQAINFVFYELLDEGDWILAEDQTFPSSIVVVQQLSARAHGLRVDAEGIVADDMQRVLTSWSDLHPGERKPKILYTIPSGGNPTGITMSLARKRAIYKLAREHDLLILEDDAYYFVMFTKPVPSFLSMDVDGRVIRLDTMSKVIAPGLRVGVVCGPAPLLAKIKLIADVNSFTASGMSQLLLAKLFRHWGYDGFLRHAEAIGQFYKQKMEVAVKCARKHLTGLAEWDTPTGGMFLWLRVPGVTQDVAVFQAMVRERVVLMYGSAFAVMPDHQRDHSDFRVTFSMVTEDQCDQAFCSLAKVIRSFRHNAEK